MTGRPAKRFRFRASAGHVVGVSVGAYRLHAMVAATAGTTGAGSDARSRVADMAGTLVAGWHDLEVILAFAGCELDTGAFELRRSRRVSTLHVSDDAKAKRAVDRSVPTRSRRSAWAVADAGRETP